jgi:hypothetical protein
MGTHSLNSTKKLGGTGYLVEDCFDLLSELPTSGSSELICLFWEGLIWGSMVVAFSPIVCLPLKHLMSQHGFAS